MQARYRAENALTRMRNDRRRCCGTVLDACFGAFFMASLDNGMSLKTYEDFTQSTVKGIIPVAAIGPDRLGW